MLFGFVLADPRISRRGTGGVYGGPLTSTGAPSGAPMNAGAPPGAPWARMYIGAPLWPLGPLVRRGPPMGPPEYAGGPLLVFGGPLIYLYFECNTEVKTDWSPQCLGGVYRAQVNNRGPPK